MGSFSKEKGKRGERRAVKILKKLWPQARRSANQANGAYMPDVIGIPMWAEVKEGLCPNIWQAWEQADHDSTLRGRLPVMVFAHRTNWGTLICMSADDFVEFVTNERGGKCDCRGCCKKDQ
jgi:hypothetical protein